MKQRALQLAYIAFVQVLFSALDVYARLSLREYASLVDAIGATWFVVWLAGQLAMLPLQIHVIRMSGIGRGVALMNGCSVLFACAGGWLIGGEMLRTADWIAAGLVLCATLLFVSAGREPASPISVSGQLAGVSNAPSQGA